MPARDSEAKYRLMLEYASKVVEIAYALQDPIRDDPYAQLAAKIIGDAKAIVREIEAFKPRT